MITFQNIRHGLVATEPLAPLSFYSFGYHFRNLDMQEAWGADERYISPDVQGSLDIFTRSELTQPISADAFTLDVELSRTQVWCDEEPVLSGVATIGLSETVAMIEKAGLAVPSILANAEAGTRFFDHPTINPGKFFVAG